MRSINQHAIQIKKIKRKCATKGCRNTATYFVSRASDNAGTPNICPECIKEIYDLMVKGNIIDETAPVLSTMLDVLQYLDRIILTDDEYLEFSDGQITFSKSGDTVINTNGYYITEISAFDNGENEGVFTYQVGDDDPLEISSNDLPIAIEDNRPITITSPGIGSSITFSYFEVNPDDYDEGTFDDDPPSDDPSSDDPSDDNPSVDDPSNVNP